MTTFTLDQDFSYAKLVMFGNILGGQVTGENTLGIQDSQIRWHPSNDEMAYRWWNERNGIPLASFVWPTVYIANNDVGNGYHGVRVFDDAGKWLGTPDNPLKALEPAPVPSPAIVASATAAPLPAPVAEQAPKPAVSVVEPKPALIAAAAVLPPAAAPAAVIVHVHPAPAAAGEAAPAPTEIHVHLTAPAPIATIAPAPAPVVQAASPAPAPAPKRGFWAWLGRLFHRKP